MKVPAENTTLTKDVTVIVLVLIMVIAVIIIKKSVILGMVTFLTCPHPLIHCEPMFIFAKVSMFYCT